MISLLTKQLYLFHFPTLKRCKGVWLKLKGPKVEDQNSKVTVRGTWEVPYAHTLLSYKILFPFSPTHTILFTNTNNKTLSLHYYSQASNLSLSLYFIFFNGDVSYVWASQQPLLLLFLLLFIFLILLLQLFLLVHGSISCAAPHLIHTSKQLPKSTIYNN